MRENIKPDLAIHVVENISVRDIIVWFVSAVRKIFKWTLPVAERIAVGPQLQRPISRGPPTLGVNVNENIGIVESLGP